MRATVRARRRLLRLLAPRIYCVFCGREVAEEDHCVCDACGAAKSYQPLTGVEGIAPFDYEEPVRSLIHRLKYGNNRYVAAYLGYAMAQALSLLDPPGDAVLIPVPLHKNRRRERGYNQSLALAEEIAALSALSLDSRALRRVMDTPSQTRLPQAQREANLRGAFAADAGRVAGKTLLLVDDVCTTGTTLAACEKALLGAGAKRVLALTAAKTLTHDDG